MSSELVRLVNVIMAVFDSIRCVLVEGKCQGSDDEQRSKVSVEI